MHSLRGWTVSSGSPPSDRLRSLRQSLLAVLLCFTALVPLEAQQVGSIRGQATSSSTGQLLAGVQVSIPGSSIGTLTNASGAYLLVNVPAGEVVIRADMIGYTSVVRTVNVTPGEATVVDFALSSTVIALDEVVITGTAGRQTRRSQPAQVAVINVGGMTETAPVKSVAEVLQARVPGVSVMEGSGASGSAQRIRIRGASSISLSNEPLIFVDGVRINARTESVNRPGEGSGSATGTGGSATSRLNDIAPEDIESIEVVKGPAAATLYGADASAGVIQIITKRGRQGGFRQSFTAEYNAIETPWTPPDNWAVCTQNHINQGVPICVGKSAGALVSDNPMVRENVFRTGNLQSLSWTGQGGTGDFTYFLSLGASAEEGTLPSTENDRRTGRVNLTWKPSASLTITAGYGLASTFNRQPDNNHSLYGFGANAMIGDPLTVGLERDGWLATRRPADIAAVKNTVDVVRNMPSLELSFEPYSWFQNRVVVGADFSNSESLRHIPRNSRNLYRTDHDLGLVRETRTNTRQVTLDYLGSIRQRFGEEAQWGSSLAFGVQAISIRDDVLWGDGLGLATNAARVVSAAAESSGGQRLTDERSVGFFGQFEVSHRERIFVQVGLRADQNSNFGEDIDAVYLPKAGVSFVASETDFWQDNLPFIGTMRLRAAYGATGRAPRAGMALETWNPTPFVTSTGGIAVGLGLLNPGNSELRPERGTEFELGFDAGLVGDRVGLEFTFFNQVTKDLILQREYPVSIGFLQDPFVNLGEVINRGVELALTARLVETPGFEWGLRVAGSTLRNELTDLGEIPAFGQFERFVQGRPLSSFFGPKIRRLDLENNRVIVSDTFEYHGSKFAGREGSITSDVTLRQNLQVTTHFDWKVDFKIDNSMARFRDTQTVRSREAIDPDYLSREDRLRRFGPFFTESGAPVPVAQSREVYFEDGDYLRLRELGLTFTLPRDMAARLRSERVAVTLAGRNLALWTRYSGSDPEGQSNLAAEGTAAFGQYEFFNVPPSRRFVLRLNFGL